MPAIQWPKSFFVVLNFNCSYWQKTNTQIIPQLCKSYFWDYDITKKEVISFIESQRKKIQSNKVHWIKRRKLWLPTFSISRSSTFFWRILANISCTFQWKTQSIKVLQLYIFVVEINIPSMHQTATPSHRWMIRIEISSFIDLLIPFIHRANLPKKNFLIDKHQCRSFILKARQGTGGVFICLPSSVAFENRNSSWFVLDKIPSRIFPTGVLIL